MRRERRGFAPRTSNLLRSMARALDSGRIIVTSFSDAERGTSRTFKVFLGKKRLSFYTRASKKSRELHLWVSFWGTTSRSSSKPSRNPAPAYYSQSEEFPPVNASPQEVTTNHLLSGIRDGSLICYRGDGCKSAHKPVDVTRNPDTQSVLIHNANGCIYVIVDHSGSVLYSSLSTPKIGVNPSSLRKNSRSSRKAKQADR